MRTYLEIMVVTRAEPFALPFLERLSALSRDLRARFVIGIDGDDAEQRL